MTEIRPFRALRPIPELAKRVAALPYDVYSREEARRETAREPLSFLNIDRPETQFPEDFDMYSDEVYQKASSLLRFWEAEGILIQDPAACFYIWELRSGSHAQTGLTACASVDDYLNGIIKKHENTLAAQQQDRIRHIDVCSMQTGPIFLAYRSDPEITEVIRKEKEKTPLYDFTAADGVTHRAWRIEEPDRIRRLTEAFAALPAAYIADGHHRAASAASAARKRRSSHPGYTGEEEFNFFLSVLFPDDELEIMEYNRVLKDLNGNTPEELLSKLSQAYSIEMCGSNEIFRPARKGEAGLYLDGTWYKLTERREKQKKDPVGTLDVEYLQREALEPIWGITDPRSDQRIDFIGGIRGPEELIHRCQTDCKAAFRMYPTSIEELFAVADAGLLMPPKSTWFEPKLRSGLFLHKIEP